MFIAYAILHLFQFLTKG